MALEDAQDARPFGIQLILGIVPVGGVPPASVRVEFQVAAFGFKDQSPAVRAEDQEVAFPCGVRVVLIIEAPADDPVVRQARQVFGHLQFAQSALLSGAILNP